MARIVPRPLGRGHVNFQSRRLFLTSRSAIVRKNCARCWQRTVPIIYSSSWNGLRARCDSAGPGKMSSERRWQMHWGVFQHLGVTAANVTPYHLPRDVPLITAEHLYVYPCFALSTASSGSRKQWLLHLGVLSGEADQITARGSVTGEGSPSGQGRVSPIMYIVKLSTWMFSVGCCCNP